MPIDWKNSVIYDKTVRVDVGDGIEAIHTLRPDGTIEIRLCQASKPNTSYVSLILLPDGTLEVHNLYETMAVGPPARWFVRATLWVLSNWFGVEFCNASAYERMRLVVDAGGVKGAVHDVRLMCTHVHLDPDRTREECGSWLRRYSQALLKRQRVTNTR